MVVITGMNPDTVDSSVLSDTTGCRTLEAHFSTSVLDAQRPQMSDA